MRPGPDLFRDYFRDEFSRGISMGLNHHFHRLLFYLFLPVYLLLIVARVGKRNKPPKSGVVFAGTLLRICLPMEILGRQEIL